MTTTEPATPANADVVLLSNEQFEITLHTGAFGPTLTARTRRSDDGPSTVAGQPYSDHRDGVPYHSVLFQASSGIATIILRLEPEVAGALGRYLVARAEEE